MTKKSSQPRINLRESFLQLQKALINDLQVPKKSSNHPVAKGDSSELQWLGMLERHVPTRYTVKKGFVVDVTGRVSEQIDLIVFDRHYSPFLLHHHGILHVPAESVYAVIEVKPVLNKCNLLYAGRKVESVRRLMRTSVEIQHAGGTFPAKVPVEIIGGFLSLSSSWKSLEGRGFKDTLDLLKANQRIEVGCALEAGSFQVQYGAKGREKIEVSEVNTALVSFFLNLMSKLQQAGTVPAMDIPAYVQSLKVPHKSKVKN